MEKRFLISKENINDDNILISGDEHKHISNVLRLKVGDCIECFFDGSDVYVCSISQISKIQTIAKIDDVHKTTSNCTQKVTLFQGLPKSDKLELIVQKCSELGIESVVPFVSQHTIAKPNDNKIERLTKISVSASKQCGRTSILKVLSPINFKNLLDKLKEFDLVVFANEKEEKTNLKDIIKNKQNIALVVGSEGGFSKQEIFALSEIAHSITLGKRILRAETASIVLSSLVMYELGELG